MRAPVVLVLVTLCLPAAAAANTSHEGWPQITGKLMMNKADQSTPLDGRALGAGHNELLGGHGNDTIHAGPAGDVLWGDYKPGGQPTTQADVLAGGAGTDFIYAGHGRNTISTGGGADQVHAHFGHGSITCTGGAPTIFLSHKSITRYKLTGCTRISFRTVGY